MTNSNNKSQFDSVMCINAIQGKCIMAKSCPHARPHKHKNHDCGKCDCITASCRIWTVEK